jgi:UrcA family protein
MKSFLTGAALAAALFIPALAEGQSVAVSGLAPMQNGGYQVKTVKVTYDDLDTATPGGAAALLDRITAAARVVCGERSGLMANSARPAFDKCRARAAAKAVEAAGIPELAKIAAAR